ncbi:ICE2-domain-containing protein [Kalaharituber pfeilii]|nr:ICE2-domain-containing protein [Kalaharituber pfeilii]
MGLLWLLARMGSALLFLLLIILTIPLAFDVGGKECGLAYSLSLAISYFVLSTFRIASSSSGGFVRFSHKVLGFFHYLLVPFLFFYFLGRWSPEKWSPKDSGNGFLKHHFESVSGQEQTWTEKFFLGWWGWFLKWSTPMFQLLEGFCTLLVIQTFGQISRWLVNRNKSDSWMIALLVTSGSIISVALYFLWRITTFPDIGNVDATLIGVAVTCAIFLCAYGIGSGKGNPVESSLLFSYIVLCIYQIFTDYKPNNPIPPEIVATKPEFPPFPPIIMESYAQLASSLAYFVPITISQFFSFVWNVISAITPSVIISLAYRLFVFYSSTRIIPAVRENGARGLEQSPSMNDEEASSRFVSLLSQYSPSILVGVYTHLLMQHFALIDLGVAKVGGYTLSFPGGGNLWRWVNIGTTMTLYGVELALGDGDGESSVTSHWKTE